MKHKGCRWLWTGALLGLFLSSGSGFAEAQSSVPDAAITAELRRLAHGAALIFVGQIVGIQRHADVVDVTFRVEQTVSGTPGAQYTMREWGELWPADHGRYTVGQRALAFVHGTSAAGFSSPVHGAEGLVPVIVQGASAPELLDIGRVAASVVRAPGTALPTERDGAVALQQVLVLLRASGSAGEGQLQRLPVPLRGHLPAAMQPRGGELRPVSATAGGAFHVSPSGTRRGQAER